MAGTGPVVAVDPVALLTNDPPVQVPYGFKHLADVIGVGIGIAWTCWYIKAKRKPALSGLPAYASAIAITYYGFSWLQKYANDYYADRDAMLRHYVQLHPDDFQPPERKKLRDVFEKWAPIR